MLSSASLKSFSLLSLSWEQQPLCWGNSENSPAADRPASHRPRTVLGKVGRVIFGTDDLAAARRQPDTPGNVSIGPGPRALAPPLSVEPGRVLIIDPRGRAAQN